MSIPHPSARSRLPVFPEGGASGIFQVDEKVKPLLWATFCLFAGESVFATVLNLRLVRDLGFSYAWVGGIFAAAMLAGAALSLPIGYACDHIGRRFVLKAGFQGWVIGLAGLAFGSSPGVLLAFSILHGIGMACVWTALAPEITELTPPGQHVKAFTADFLMMYAGSVIGFAAGGLLPWVVPFLFGTSVSPYKITMLIGVLAMFPTYRFLAALPWERLPSGRDRITRPGRAERRRRTRTLFKVIVPYLFCGVTVGLTAPFVNIFLKSVFATSDHTVGFSLAAVSAFQCLLIILIPMFVTRIGRVPVTALALILAAPLLFLISWISSAVASVLLMVVAIGLVQMSIPLQLSFAMRQCPSLQRGFLSSELAAVWYLANGIGAFLSVGAAENDLAEIGRGYQPAAVFCLLAGIFYWIFWRRSQKLPEDCCTQADHLACSHPSSGRLAPASSPG